MFGRQKTQIDIKKSTQKILDRKKDNPTKLKHLRLIIDTFDTIETKVLFCTHYEPIYKIVYEGIVCAEANLKQRGVHRAQREELESVLYLFEKILVLCPDLLNGRWQLHSVSRLMAKLNHPGNSTRLRREGIRLFLIWYQCLGKNAPAYVHKVFASLVPGFGTSPSTAWPPAMDDASQTLGVSPLEIIPLIPSSSNDKQPEDSTSYYLECVLDFMVSQAPKVHWNGGPEMWAKSMDFLFERFKEFYLPKFFTNFQVVTDIYKPVLELPEPRKSSDMASNLMYTCQVVFVKWIANYAHSVYRSTDCYHPTNVWSTRSNFVSLEDSGKLQSSGQSSLSGDRESLTSYSSMPNDVDANVLAKDVILGTRENINLLHEVFRRALLLPFVHSAAIRRVICVYKDWIQINVPELPVFMLEPEDVDVVDDCSGGSGFEIPKSRLRTDSYYGAIGYNANNNREEYLSHLRAGAQKILRVFFCNSAAVFLHVQIPKHEGAITLLEEQVDICKRVLNIYRYAVMNTRMDPRTWEQLLVVLLHITSTVLDVSLSPVHQSNSKHLDTLGQKLASAMFQTLIVSWVKASLNVPISIELWDQLESVLSQLTIYDELVTEWAKTMETLTRVLARHVYNLDLTNLPLERLTEQKAKRKRGMESGGGASREVSKVSVGTPEGPVFTRKRNISQSSERKSIVFSPTSHSIPSKKGLKRSLSEGNLSFRRSTIPPSDGGYDTPDARMLRVRKMSKSMDSLRRAIPKEGLLTLSNCSTTVTQQSDWAQISSSTASLENASTTHVEGDSLDGSHIQHPDREELKGVIAGGKVKGWLPSVSAILWRRMLGILGNVNQFPNPRTHAHFFQIIADTWATLYKIRQNQGVSLDNLTTPTPPELVPPVLLPAPWCFEALNLPNEYHRGKVTACALLCSITLSNEDVTFQPEYLYKFYATIHKCTINNNQYVVNEIVKRCGLRFISKMLPGFSLLLLDLVQAAHCVLSSDDLRNDPRLEASALLGSILGVSDIFKNSKVLRPNSAQFHPIDAQYTKLVLSYLIKTAKIEKTSQARAIALQSLTVYLCRELTELKYRPSSNTDPQLLSVEQHNMLHDIFAVLIASVQVCNRSVVLVAADCLLMLSEFATEVMTHFPKVGRKLILVLKSSLERALPLRNSMWTSLPREVEKRLFISLMLTLGEWVMRTPLEILLDTVANDSEKLLPSVFDVLQMVARGHQSPGAKASTPTPVSEDFDSNIPFDDLQTTDKRVTMESDTATMAQDLQTIKLAARSLMSHLLTQFGHFPISNCASRCCSIVSENDDLGVDETELQLNIFSLPNLQMFAIDDETLLTMIELPVEDGNLSNLSNKIPMSQVRLILRDLSGKACWDATCLIGPSTSAEENGISFGVSQLRHSEDMYFHSAITGSFFPQIGARLTVRHRNAGHLPTVENSAEDLDNLDDLLEYIGHTSPECILKNGESLTTPWATPVTLTQDQEDEVVGAVVSQRSAEFEYLTTVDLDVTMRAKSLHCANEMAQDILESEENSLSLGATSRNNFSSSFLRCRRLFSQLGFNGWEKRPNIYLLNKDEKLLRELKHLDNQKCREFHKIAVIYVAHGQEDKQSILYNTAGSEEFEDFVSGLGWEVELETHTGFMGGLPRNKNSGETSPYYATSFTEVIFHVSTRLPSDTEESLLLKTRHLGNDEVHIVWSEHKRDYRRDIIPTEFCDVLIVIYPLRYGLFRIQISKKSEIPYFGPLHNESVIHGDVLALLVRSTAINASRARRSCLPYFQHHFQERSKALSTIIQNHKVRTTFEQFAANVFSPMLPTSSFVTGTNSRASGSSFTSTVRASSNSSTNSGHAVSAFSDHSNSTSQSGPHNAPSRRMTTGPNFLSSSSFSPYENVTISPNTGRINASHQIHISNSNDINSTSTTSSGNNPPVPPKRLAIKGSSIKPKLHTPPASPATSLRSTPGSIK